MRPSLYTGPMQLNAMTYTDRQTPVHDVGSSIKIVLLLAYSIMLFLIRTWMGMGICIVLFALCAILSRLPILQCVKQLLPIWVVLGVTLLANSLSLDVSQAASPHGIGLVSAGALGGYAPVALIGTFGFVPAGFARGCYYVLRIALLAFASVVLTTTSTTTQLTQSLEGFLRPFARVGMPVRDVATIVSIAMRFIPVTFDEFQMVKSAQQSRGAPFDTGSISARLRAWTTVFIPLFVGLFRRADSLASAMDVRCYGMGKATHLNESKSTVGDRAVLVIGLVICLVVSVLL